MKKIIKKIICNYRLLTYYNKSKTILLVTHDMGLSGAPIVLLNLACTLKKNGYSVLILADRNGPLLEECKKLSIPVIIAYDFNECKNLEYFLSKFETIIVNTIVNVKIITILNNTDKKVIWWIHEGKTYIDKYIGDVPEKILNNIHIYCVGNYVYQILNSYDKFKDLSIGILNYGLNDQYNISKNNDIRKNIKIRITTIGSICKRKNQIEFIQMANKIHEQRGNLVEFFIIGNPIEEDYYKIFLEELESNKYIKYIPFMKHDEIINFIHQNDIMICTSQDDPMPVFITEAMMSQNITICNKQCGQYYYIVDKLNGFNYQLGNYIDLVDKINYILDNITNFEVLKKESRNIYLKNFTNDVFDRKVLKALNDLNI